MGIHRGARHGSRGPSFIFILLVQKHLVRGLTLGSLKE